MLPRRETQRLSEKLPLEAACRGGEFLVRKWKGKVKE
jgi:hypothetical protein